MAAIFIGLAAAGLVAAAFGRGVVPFYRALALGAFGGAGPLIATLAKTAPLILAGLAVAVPLRGGLFNVGGEGQMYVGALVTVTASFVFAPLPAFAAAPLALLAGALGGAGYASAAGVLKSRYGVHEVVSTIMLNFVALHATAYLANHGPLAAAGGLGRTMDVPFAARLPVLLSHKAWELSAAIFVALAAAAVAWWFVDKSVQGYRLRAAGGNPLAASRKGINLRRTTLVAMAAAGAAAGLAGAVEVAGHEHFVSVGFSSDYGFDGIAVALLAGASIPAVPLAAFLFAAVRSAGSALQLDAGLSPEVIFVIEAVIVVAAAVPEVPGIFARLRPRVAPAAEA